ncbi:hypothetical protein [Lysobacter sp. cf310]|uniref:hypothetical protein n=1 Tax=Lysobacter sp. cf310 TaxID=1761790 RepID=UPI0008E62959|nr:hypothetical protein [Lysobacter sp. cf310]SFK36903.1 hypothetical protein SAMN04487938_0502 [Lysobacter sp. cf310]
MNAHVLRPLALALSALLAGVALTACSKPEPPAGELPPPATDTAAPADTAPPPADTAPPPSDGTPPATDAGTPPPVEGSSNQTPPDQPSTDAKPQPAQ